MDEAVGVGLAPRTDEHLGRRRRDRGCGCIVIGCCLLFQVGRCGRCQRGVTERGRERERGRGLTVFAARGAGRVVEYAHVFGCLCVVYLLV